jgi:ABC-type transport system substrate-binding protein
MKNRSMLLLVWLVIFTMLTSIALVGCGATPTPPPAEAKPTTAPAEATKAPETAKVVNRAGVELPADAAPLDQQVMRYAEKESTWLTWDASVYDEMVGDVYAWADSCTRPDEFYEPQPNGCVSWEVADDGLTWTFHLQEDKKWSDGTPLTAEDYVARLMTLSGSTAWPTSSTGARW